MSHNNKSPENNDPQSTATTRLAAETDSAVEPEVVYEGSEDTGKIESLFRRRLKKARGGIDRFIEARAIRRDMDPEPIIETLWQLLLLLPRFVKLIYKLMVDSRVPWGMRIKCAMALAYVAVPVDLLSEALLGPLGMIDDIVVIMVVLDVLLNNIDPAIIEEHWTGNADILKLLKSSVGTVRSFLPPPVYNSILKFFGGRG